MGPVVRSSRRRLPAVLVAAMLGVGVFAGAIAGPEPAAWADDEAPVKPGATLVARGDCELQKVTIPRGARVEVTASSGDAADIALPDGHVLHRIPLSRLRYFFDVAR